MTHREIETRWRGERSLFLLLLSVCLSVCLFRRHNTLINEHALFFIPREETQTIVNFPNFRANFSCLFVCKIVECKYRNFVKTLRWKRRAFNWFLLLSFVHIVETLIIEFLGFLLFLIFIRVIRKECKYENLEENSQIVQSEGSRSLSYLCCCESTEYLSFIRLRKL